MAVAGAIAAAVAAATAIRAIVAAMVVAVADVIAAARTTSPVPKNAEPANAANRNAGAVPRARPGNHNKNGKFILNEKANASEINIISKTANSAEQPPDLAIGQKGEPGLFAIDTRL